MVKIEFPLEDSESNGGGAYNNIGENGGKIIIVISEVWGQTYNFDGFVKKMNLLILTEYLCNLTLEKHPYNKFAIINGEKLYFTKALCKKKEIFELMINGCQCKQIAEKML